MTRRDFHFKSSESLARNLEVHRMRDESEEQFRLRLADMFLEKTGDAHGAVEILLKKYKDEFDKSESEFVSFDFLSKEGSIVGWTVFRQESHLDIVDYHKQGTRHFLF